MNDIFVQLESDNYSIRKHAVEKIFNDNLAKYIILTNIQVHPVLCVDSNMLCFGMPKYQYINDNIFTDTQLNIYNSDDNIEVTVGLFNAHLTLASGYLLQLREDDYRIYLEYIKLLAEKSWFINNTISISIKEEYLKEFKLKLFKLNKRYIVELRNRVRILSPREISKFTISEMFIYYISQLPFIKGNHITIRDLSITLHKYWDHSRYSKPKVYPIYVVCIRHLYEDNQYNKCNLYVDLNTTFYLFIDNQYEKPEFIYQRAMANNIIYITVNKAWLSLLNVYVSAFATNGDKADDIFMLYDDDKKFCKLNMLISLKESDTIYLVLHPQVNVDKIQDNLNAIAVMYTL